MPHPYYHRHVDTSDSGYVQPTIKIESGAKSALDPNKPRTITPFIADDVATLDLAVPSVTTIDTERTSWGKVMIAHGLHSWFDRRGELKQDGQCASRHYYDLQCMLTTDVGSNTVADLALGSDCIEYAKTFFNRPDFNLATAVQGSFALVSHGDMVDRLAGDYENTKAMIFGDAPEFDVLMYSIARLEEALN